MGIKVKDSGIWKAVHNHTFNTLTELTSVEDADEMSIWDASDGADPYKKVGIDTLRGLTPVTADADWHVVGDTGEPAFQNSWSAYNATTHDVPRFRKDGFGYVVLDGDVGGGTNNTTAFTLPAGYRPGKEKVFAYAWSNELVSSATAIPTIVVEADGDVRPVNGSGNGASLSGLRFLAEA